MAEYGERAWLDTAGWHTDPVYASVAAVQTGFVLGTGLFTEELADTERAHEVRGIAYEAFDGFRLDALPLCLSALAAIKIGRAVVCPEERSIVPRPRGMSLADLMCALQLSVADVTAAVEVNLERRVREGSDPAVAEAMQVPEEIVAVLNPDHPDLTSPARQEFLLRYLAEALRGHDVRGRIALSYEPRRIEHALERMPPGVKIVPSRLESAATLPVGTRQALQRALQDLDAGV